jgi:uncharacterized linocin/CFP29 family protein
MNNQLFTAWVQSGGQSHDLLGGMRPYLNARNQPVAYLNGLERMVQNALLRKYEWEQIDAAVYDVVRQPNIAVNDFLRMGLTTPLDGLGVTISTYEQLTDMTAADMNMNGEVRGEKDRVGFTPQNIPVPLIYKDFQLSLRHLEASRRGQGSALDTTQAIVATRKVQDRVDDMIFNGETKQLGANIIYGFTNKPERIQQTATQLGGGDFATGTNGYKTLQGAVNALSALGYYGPFGAYISRTQYGQLNALIANTAVSLLATTLAQTPGLAFIRPSDKLKDGEGIVWQTTKDVADLAIAQDVTPVQWESMGGFLVDFRIFIAVTVRVKHDSNGACGLLHFTGA